MQIVGVIDIRHGIAVHARGGRREQYQPVQHALAQTISGEAEALARSYVDICGLADIYVADLDAISGEPPQYPLVRRLAGLGARIWLDAGIDSVDDARQAVDAGASSVIVGLETLPDFSTLGAIASAIGGGRVLFSLDLDHGRPRVVANGPQCHSVEHVAASAVAAGVEQMIVLDLARVGSRTGVDIGLVSDLASRLPQCRIYAGGGVASTRDLHRLAEAGIEGALVATALIEGHITPAQIRELTSTLRWNTARQARTSSNLPRLRS